jgi:hypothetical protein
MAPRFPCPMCAHLRKAFDAECESCRYPNHVRLPESNEAHHQMDRWRFQYDIGMLMVITAVTAFVFAGERWWGFSGLWMRIYYATGIVAFVVRILLILRKLNHD